MRMNWLRLLTQSNRLGDAQRLVLASAGASIRTVVTVATIWTVAAQSLFIINFFGSLVRGKKSEANNPWRASTLEWSIASPVPVENFGGEEPVVYRGAYEFAVNGGEDFAPQHLSPELLVQEAD